MCRLLARLCAFSALGVLALMIGISDRAVAAGNVLLPPTSSNSNSAPLPSLGITAAPAPTDALPPVPATTPPPASPTATAPPALPAASTQPQTLPPAALSTPAMTTPDMQHMVTYPDDPQTVTHLPPGQMQTEIIHAPDMSALLAQMGQNLPYSLTVSLSGQSIYGANDVKAITAKTGLTASQIPSACILSVRGLMRTSKGPAMVDSGAAPQTQVHYDGTIQGYMLSARASCTVDKLPPGVGIITETGGRYQIPLQPVTCAAPTRQISQLIITYTGDNKTQCAYQ